MVRIVSELPEKGSAVVRYLWKLKIGSVHVWIETEKVFVSIDHINLLPKLWYLWGTVFVGFAVWRKHRQAHQYETESHAQTFEKLLRLHPRSQVNAFGRRLRHGPTDLKRPQSISLPVLPVLRLLWPIRIHPFCRHLKPPPSPCRCLHRRHYHQKDTNCFNHLCSCLIDYLGFDRVCLLDKSPFSWSWVCRWSQCNFCTFLYYLRSSIWSLVLVWVFSLVRMSASVCLRKTIWTAKKSSKTL